MTDTETGIQIVSVATTHDASGRAREAYYLYYLSISFFQKAANDPKTDPNTKQILIGKIKEYADRAEQLAQGLGTTNLPKRIDLMALASQQAQNPLTMSQNQTVSSLTSSFSGQTNSTTQPTSHSRLTSSSSSDLPPFEAPSSNLPPNSGPKKEKDLSKLTLNLSRLYIQENKELVSAPPSIDWNQLQKEHVQKSRNQEVVAAPPAIDWTSIQESHSRKWKVEEENSSGGMLFNLLTSATEKIEKATQADHNEEYDEALYLYQDGLRDFSQAAELEKNPKTQAAIRQKIKEYLIRAEQVKFLRSKPPSGQSPSQPATPAKPKAEVKVSAAASEAIETAIDLATRATSFDQTGQISAALEHYRNAIDAFQIAAKIETNPAILAMIKEKLVGYNLRVTTLQQILTHGVPISNPIPTGLEKKGQKYKPPKQISHGLKAKKTWE